MYKSSDIQSQNGMMNKKYLLPQRRNAFALTKHYKCIVHDTYKELFITK